jgi:hypothetical protein
MKKNTFLHIFGILWAAAVILACARKIVAREEESLEDEH